MRERWNETRIDDMLTFLAVQRNGSVSHAARELGVTPSQVSKALTRLGEHLGRRLVTRSAHGMSLTDEGRRLAPELEATVARLRLALGHDVAPARELGFAAPSYLVTTFAPHIVAALPSMRVRALELSPAQLRVFATERLFDVALVSGWEKLPEAWTLTSVGEDRKGLYAPPLLAKKLRPFPASADRLHDVPFVTPFHFSNGQIVPGDDSCPLRRSDRRLGHEATTIGIALTLAARSEQLVFGPVIAARPFVERGLLEEVPVRGWAVQDTLYLACHSDRLLAKDAKAIARAVRIARAAIDGA